MSNDSYAVLDFAAFEQMLQDLLNHFYDPGYAPPEALWQLLQLSGERSPHALHACITAAIQALRPAAGAPAAARLQRYHDLLAYRYIQELTQKETAQRMRMSPRHLRREQQMAVQALAYRLWHARNDTPEPPLNEASADPPEPAAAAPLTSGPWAAQVHRELAALNAHAPANLAWVQTEMERACKVMADLLAARGLRLALAGADGGPPAEAPLAAQVHPSVLRQILITAIEDLAGHVERNTAQATRGPRGTLRLRAQRLGSEVGITLAAEPLRPDQNPPGEADRNATPAWEHSVWALLAGQVGSTSFSAQGGQAEIRLHFAEARSFMVLVIDDNRDVEYVVRRYTAGTEYQVRSLPDPEADPLPQVAALHPDAVLLDVLMPSLDGWELLAQLRAHGATALTPVIICSVLHRAELAQALGAAAHLDKPFSSQDLLAALRAVTHGAHAAALPAENPSPR